MAEPLNLTHLRSLVAVVDRQSFTRAARMLHLSQSTVSQHILLLEKRVGGELLVREPNGARPTPLGAEFVDRARILLAGHDELLGDFDVGCGSGGAAAGAPGDRRRQRRRIAVGSAEPAADPLLPALVAGFGAAFPGHELSFTLQRSTVLIDAVRNGDLDLAVTLAITPDAPGTRVGQLPLRWVTGEQPGLAGGGEDEAIRPGAGRTLPLVVLEEPCAIRGRALDLLAAAGYGASVVAQSASLDGVVSAVRGGLGAGLVPVAADVPAGLRELAGLPPAGAIGVHLVARDGLADTVTYTAVSMLRSLLAVATGTSSGAAATGISPAAGAATAQRPSPDRPHRAGRCARGSGAARRLRPR